MSWRSGVVAHGNTAAQRRGYNPAHLYSNEDISTRAMIDHFKPLMNWLEEENKGRQVGWE